MSAGRRARLPEVGTALALVIGAGLLAAGEAAAQVLLTRLPDGSRLLTNHGGTPRPSSRRPRVEIDRLIDRQARQQSLDPRLVHAVVHVESSYDSSALSRKGAMGLMQLMPATARSLEVDDPYDPEQNLRGGTLYLRRLLDRFGGDLELALASYNAGPEAVERHRGLPPYAETHAYVDRVLRLLGGDRPAAAGRRTLSRKTFLSRDASGRLLMTTSPPTGR